MEAKVYPPQFYGPIVEASRLPWKNISRVPISSYLGLQPLISSDKTSWNMKQNLLKWHNHAGIKDSILVFVSSTFHPVGAAVVRCSGRNLLRPNPTRNFSNSRAACCETALKTTVADQRPRLGVFKPFPARVSAIDIHDDG
jgi:hypothetical protein